MNLAHPPSTSMVEGEHTSTNIDRLIGLRRPSTVNSEVLLQLTADESIVDDCSTAAYRSWKLLPTTLMTYMKFGLTAKPRTHTGSVAVTHRVDGGFRPCSLELLQASGCAHDVERWGSEALYTS